MKTAADYPITTGYGYVPGYPLNGGFHKGQDRTMPVGTPVVVNGVVISFSGNTGASTGPHLHIGRFVGGQPTNPQGAGFTITNAIVSEVGSDSTNGNYVKILDGGDGATWVYLHNSEINVTKGQRLDDMYGGKTAQQWANEASANAGVAQARERYLNQIALAAGVNPDKPINQPEVNQIVTNIDSLNKQVAAAGSKLEEVPGPLYRKKA